ncbi:MAG: glutamate--tRNA ligase [bacterium]|nr:glutamate--tRNA ligase [bacterium]
MIQNQEKITKSGQDNTGQDNICVRFAPSPTGFLHVGGARTALYNWLFARKQRGTFILRIEDTDVERSEERFWRKILEDLEWLGLNWDKGPFFQHERREIYVQKAQELVQKQKAYYCFCSPQELERQREEAARKDIPFRYDGRCLKIPAQEALERIQAGKPAAIRFRVPEAGKTEFHDLIHGKVSFDNRQLDDFIILRSNGLPTYNLAAVVDDMMMNITHIIRGDDHISNTPKQILLYQALGFPCPQFAHIPMIMGPDNTRLSKRHGAVAVGQYREAGYLPEALVNYLALLGWSYDGQQTIFSIPELIEKFDLKKVSKKAAIFDPVKLDWMNGKYIRQIDEQRYISLALAFLHKAGLVNEAVVQQPPAAVIKILLSVRDKFKKFSELPALVDFFFVDSITLTEEARSQIMASQDNLSLLKELYERLLNIEVFDEVSLEALFQDLIREKGIKMASLAQPVRAAVTGRSASPGVFLTMSLLGRERVLTRLANCLQTLGGGLRREGFVIGQEQGS